MQKKDKMKKPQKGNRSNKTGKTLNSWRDSDWAFIADKLMHSDLNSIEEFYRLHNIPRTTFYKAVNDHECMKEAHVYFMEGCGLKKLKVCEEKMLTMNTVLAYQLPQYLKRFKDDAEWRARLKEEQNTASAEIIKEVLKEVLQPIAVKKES